MTGGGVGGVGLSETCLRRLVHSTYVGWCFGARDMNPAGIQLEY